MLFHSQIFVLAFLPAALAAFYALADRPAAREWVLILFSLIFYGWWDARFLPLLIGQVTISWLIAGLAERTGNRALLTLGIGLNLATLGLFKYAGFFLDLARNVTGLELPVSPFVLPIGISFFSFQIISYFIDRMRGEAPLYPLRRFALFVMLFPHLIAGPIVRHNEIIPQFDKDPLRPDLAERLSRGIALFIIAFLVKVVLADRLAVHVNQVFATANTQAPAFAEAWLGAIGFALQIYLDFSAYSEMAIAIALMFGFHFPLNFNVPYRATSLREFWRRWHMSLSRFLRDYLYIPLGGSRHGEARFMFASLATMGLCGLWHGAGLTFIAWGLLHGIGLIVCRFWQRQDLPMPPLAGWFITTLFVVLAFVLFRAPGFAAASHMFAGLAGQGGIGRLPDGAAGVLLLIGSLYALVPHRPNPALIQSALRPSRAVAVLFALGAVYAVLEVGKGAPVSFIYFQF